MKNVVRKAARWVWFTFFSTEPDYEIYYTPEEYYSLLRIENEKWHKEHFPSLLFVPQPRPHGYRPHKRGEPIFKPELKPSRPFIPNRVEPRKPWPPPPAITTHQPKGDGVVPTEVPLLSSGVIPTDQVIREALATKRVVCAAMMRSDGLIVCGALHYDGVMRKMVDATGGRETWLGCEQGFIDQFGNFLTREEAHRIATKQGQIFRRCGGDEKELYSENLY